jgi:mannose-1-phosphate guanylyltransferase/mannose-6-phosphate isomerase
MEKTRNASVVACDIGCWRALGDLTAPDDDNNCIYGKVIVGLDSLIIVDRHDALLVVDKNQTQDVKKIYTKLKLQEHEAHKLHHTAHRPWGSYTVLGEGVNF